MIERIVGFGARKLIDFRSWWNPQRCATYLLREDVTRVLSVDEYVWPGVFARATCSGAVPSSVESAVFSGPPAPEKWIGMNKPFWSDLAELRDHLICNSAHIPRPYCIVAVTCVTDATHDEQQRFPYPETVSPAALQGSWDFLGFDVADDLISGLSNCGYDSSDFSGNEKSQWAALLNDAHLVRSLEDAKSILEFTNQRVPEHAPFMIYGLYAVELQGS